MDGGYGNPGTVCPRSSCLGALDNANTTFHEKTGTTKTAQNRAWTVWIDKDSGFDSRNHSTQHTEPWHGMSRSYDPTASSKFSIFNSRETRDRVQLANQVDSWVPSGPPVPVLVSPCGWSPLFFWSFPACARASTAGLGWEPDWSSCSDQLTGEGMVDTGRYRGLTDNAIHPGPKFA